MAETRALRGSGPVLPSDQNPEGLWSWGSGLRWRWALWGAALLGLGWQEPNDLTSSGFWSFGSCHPRLRQTNRPATLVRFRSNQLCMLIPASQHDLGPEPHTVALRAVRSGVLVSLISRSWLFIANGSSKPLKWITELSAYISFSQLWRKV